MVIELTKNEIVIRLLPTIDTDELQELVNYFRYKELTSKYRISQSIVDELSSKINKKWYKENKKRLLDEDCG